MTDVAASLRGQVYARDGYRCVACGRPDHLTFQHREAKGAGGRGKKAPNLTAADGVTLCLLDNVEAEAYGQDRALALGHKIRRNRGQMQSHEIPYFDYASRSYYLPTIDGMRTRVSHSLALELLEAAGNLTRKAS